jgi:hypothetical protein
VSKLDVRWYYVDSGKRFGPIEPEQLQQLAQSGIIKPETLVWRKGLENWVAANLVKGLFEKASENNHLKSTSDDGFSISRNNKLMTKAKQSIAMSFQRMKKIFTNFLKNQATISGYQPRIVFLTSAGLGVLACIFIISLIFFAKQSSPTDQGMSVATDQTSQEKLQAKKQANLFPNVPEKYRNIHVDWYEKGFNEASIFATQFGVEYKKLNEENAKKNDITKEL